MHSTDGLTDCANTDSTRGSVFTFSHWIMQLLTCFTIVRDLLALFLRFRSGSNPCVQCASFPASPGVSGREDWALLFRKNDSFFRTWRSTDTRTTKASRGACIRLLSCSLGRLRLWFHLLTSTKTWPKSRLYEHRFYGGLIAFSFLLRSKPRNGSRS